MFYGSLASARSGLSGGGSQSSSIARRAESQVVLLEADVERLLMITEALWTMLKEQHGYTDSDLIKRVAAIDMRDGKLDGRVADQEGPLTCPQCSRTLIGNRPVCLYCGKPVARDPFER
jgi:hypothetical protein